MCTVEAFPTDPGFLKDVHTAHPRSDFAADIVLFATALKDFQVPNLEYHNWDGHVRSSFIEAMRLVDECEKNDTPVDRTVVAFAILAHDSGYSQNDIVHEKYGSKEAYSAHVAEQTLLTFGKDRALIDKVKQAIMATKLGESCETIEDRIVRRADIVNTSNSFSGVIANFLNLQKEANHTRNIRATKEVAIKQACFVIDQYISTDLSLGAWDESYFVNRVRNNTKRLMQEGEQFLNGLSFFN